MPTQLFAKCVSQSSPDKQNQEDICTYGEGFIRLTPNVLCSSLMAVCRLDTLWNL